MKRHIRRNYAALVILTLAASAPLIAQQAVSPTGAPVKMLVTVEARHGNDVPIIYREDVMVHQGRDRVPVKDWVPLQGDHAGIELFILIDDATTGLGAQLDELRAFIRSQPATNAIAVGYMQNGTVQTVQNFTKDHSLAAKSLRLPIGSASGSPYFSVEDLIKHWPEGPVPREILMVSDGIDRFGNNGPNNFYVISAIEQAQRAGIPVFTMYAPGVGHYGHSYWRMTWGQNYLSQIADETGGEEYYLGLGAPVSFKPYLDDLSRRLAHQYMLTFLAKPQKKAGLQPVKLTTEVPNAEVVSANKVYVPAEP